MTRYSTFLLVNQEIKKTLIDSGCSQSFISQKLVRPEQWVMGEQVLITCVHGDSKTYPVAIIQMKWRGEEESVLVGAIPDLVKELIVGTDYISFPELLDSLKPSHQTESWRTEAPH
ncbi:hypothetical protein NDU88_002307 [Pleurodeles waltl]|uniref:Uncharacterized protein n=1 Tax=Pleurodeles waltl TaxID=8319 RepID=A0AAV7VC67_PLEWA|nr:hypothetical protein NDU88_002307 [Pleurodeles waltl]